MAIPLYSSSTSALSLTRAISTHHTDLGDPQPVWPVEQGCAGIRVYIWTKTSTEWQQSRIFHGSPLSPGDTAQPCISISEAADVAIFVVPHEMQLKFCGDCRKSFDDAFLFLPRWWQKPYIHSNGYFGCRDEFDDQGRSIGVRKYP